MTEEDQEALVAGFAVAVAVLANLVNRSQMPLGWEKFADTYGGPRLPTDRSENTSAVAIIDRAIRVVKEYDPR